MRFLRSLLLVVLSSASLFAQTTPQRSIQMGDLDRKADPCTDFFQFANGAWRANNPIPASMTRWSRRWQAGEQAKEQLRVILDGVSLRTDWPKGSVEQLIGDFYGSCMDEARIDKLGVSPAEPMLKEIDGAKSAA